MVIDFLKNVYVDILSENYFNCLRMFIAICCESSDNFLITSLASSGIPLWIVSLVALPSPRTNQYGSTSKARATFNATSAVKVFATPFMTFEIVPRVIPALLANSD